MLKNTAKGLAIVLAVGLGALLAGCQKSGSTVKDGVLTVTIPSYKTGENVGAVFFVPQVERFNQKYAGKYRIVLESVPEATFIDRVKQLAQQKKLPVLVQSTGGKDWFRSVAIPNKIAFDLAPWLDTKPEIKSLLLEDSLEYSTTPEGGIYSLPLANVRPTGFFYNSTMWNPDKKVSEMTMDEFISALGNEKIAFSTAENGWVSALFLTAFIAEEPGGLEILQNGLDSYITDFNQPPIIEAVRNLQSLMQKNAAPNSIGATYADAANSFMGAQAAVIANGPWMSGDFAPNASDKWSGGFNGAQVRGSLFPENIGIASTRTYGEWFIAASASEAERELALAFFEFIYSPEELEAYCLAEGGSVPNLEPSESYLQALAAQSETAPVLADLAADTTEETRFAPNILDVIPVSVATQEFGKLLPSLADGTYTPEAFCSWLSQKAEEAVAR